MSRDGEKRFIFLLIIAADLSLSFSFLGRMSAKVPTTTSDMTATSDLSLFRQNKFLIHFFRESKSSVEIRLADSTVYTYPLDLLKPLSTLISDLSHDLPRDVYHVNLSMFPNVKEEHFVHVDQLLLEFADDRYDLTTWARSAVGRPRQAYVPHIAQDLAALDLLAVVSYLGADFIMAKMESSLIRQLRRFALDEAVLVNLEAFFARHDFRQCTNEANTLLYAKRRVRIKQFVQDTATKVELDTMLSIVENSTGKKRKI